MHPSHRPSSMVYQLSNISALQQTLSIQAMVHGPLAISYRILALSNKPYASKPWSIVHGLSAISYQPILALNKSTVRCQASLAAASLYLVGEVSLLKAWFTPS
jgi:hypothetical protein